MPSTLMLPGTIGAVRPEQAAATIAARFGVVVSSPVTLANSNNAVVWLAPSPVVAKVGTGHHRRLGLELAVARHLVGQGAPVVAPSPELPREVHHVAGFDLTFWEYRSHDRTEVEPGRLGLALFALHEALATFSDPLPRFDDELDQVNRILTGGRCSPALRDADRALLLAALDRFRAELASCEWDPRALHGSAHDLNVLVVDGAPLFIDFETACRGPVEWDLAHVGPVAATVYPTGFNPHVRNLCRALTSVKTAAWCWAKVEHPDLRWHAKHHLDVVRGLMA
jgi:Ser/Thr protein kinase RdoA (MazF antagonist)